MKLPALLAATISGALALLPSPVAWACSPAFPAGTISANVYGNVVELDAYDGAYCPARDGMLRQNVATGEVVRIPDACSPAWGYDAGVDKRSDGGDAGPLASSVRNVFIDECVPAGTYRYGRAKPVACRVSDGVSNGALYFAVVTVAQALPEDCARTLTADAPVPVAAAPWGEDEWICQPQGDLCNDSFLCDASGAPHPEPASPAAALLVGGLLLPIVWHRRRRA